MNRPRRCWSFAVLVGILLASSACSKPSSDLASMSCQSFMQMSQSSRDDAVTKVASQLKNPDVVTPLGRPNVEYLCAQMPAETLGHVVDVSRNSRAPATQRTGSTSPTNTTTTQAWITSISGTAKLRSTDGYTLDAQYRLHLGDSLVSVANDKPGHSSVTVEGDASLALINTTPGRNAKLGMESDIAMYAVWLNGDKLCQLDSMVEKGPCAIQLGRSGLPITLQPNESRQVFETSLCGSQTQTCFGVGNIPDADLASIRAIISKPDLIVITSNGIPMGPWSACAGSAGYEYILWTSKGQCFSKLSTFGGPSYWFWTAKAPSRS